MTYTAPTRPTTADADFGTGSTVTNAHRLPALTPAAPKPAPKRQPRVCVVCGAPASRNSPYCFTCYKEKFTTPAPAPDTDAPEPAADAPAAPVAMKPSPKPQLTQAEKTALSVRAAFRKAIELWADGCRWNFGTTDQPDQLTVPSASRPGTHHTLTICAADACCVSCDCEAGQGGKFCWHVAAYFVAYEPGAAVQASTSVTVAIDADPEPKPDATTSVALLAAKFPVPWIRDYCTDRTDSDEVECHACAGTGMDDGLCPWCGGCGMVSLSDKYDERRSTVSEWGGRD